MTVVEPRARTWTRGEYHRLAGTGVFDGQRVQLIEGTIVEMNAQKSSHAAAVDKGRMTLERAWSGPVYVRCQVPLVLGSRSEPEPDLAVVSGEPDDYATAHPETALLVVEVADTSLRFDRTEKRALYAKAAIPEYWIVNLVDRRLEVHRKPSGKAFSERFEVGAGGLVTPLHAPEGTRIAVDQLLPRSVG